MDPDWWTLDSPFIFIEMTASLPTSFVYCGINIFIWDLEDLLESDRKLDKNINWFVCSNSTKKIEEMLGVDTFAD